jgi:hypothetical protein
MPRLTAIAAVLVTLCCALGCANQPPEREAPATPAIALPAPLRLRVLSTETTPLASTLKPDDLQLRLPREAAVDTPAGRFVARVEATKTSVESTASRIVLRAHSRDSGTVVHERVIKEDAVNVFGLAWAPDGSSLAFCEGALVSVAGWSGDPQILHAGPGGPYPGACTDLSWSADRRQLRFIQVEHATDPSLANPARVTLELGLESSPAKNGTQP